MGFLPSHPGFSFLDQVAACISDVSIVVDEVQSVAAENRQNRSIVVRSRSSPASIIPSSPLSVTTCMMYAPTTSYRRSTYVRDLGIYIDSDMSMRIDPRIANSVQLLRRSTYARLRDEDYIQRSVSQPVLLSLVSSLVLSRLDYGSTVLTGFSRQLVDRLQSVLNAAARLI